MTARFLPFALVVLLLSACGGDDATDSAESACRALCDKQGQATGCGAGLASYVMLCKSVCGALVAQLDDECKATAEAAYRCQAGLDYMCFADGDVPLQTTAACQAELAAYQECLPTGGE